MANYYASARTSYFKVKDEIKFREWAKSRTLEVWETTENDPYTDKLFALGPNRNDAGFASLYLDDDELTSDECEPFDGQVDITEELREHIADDWAAIYVEAGSEKLRYVIGLAAVITSKEITTMEINKWATNWCKENNCKHTNAEF